MRALYKVLRPMVRLLMRHGVSYRSFSEVARRVYIDVAEEDFSLERRKPSNSRTAVLTGINRKDIAKYKERPHPLDNRHYDPPNPPARVITGWLNDPRFHDQSGQPKLLPIEDASGEASFTLLVNEHSTDVTVRAVLDELIRLNACSRQNDKVQLLVNGYIPLEDMQETLRIFGTAAADLLNTMDHNIGRLPPGPFLQRTVSYDNIPEELINTVRQRCREEGDRFLLQTNEWLATQDRNENQKLIGSGRYRAGIGIYYIEQAIEDNSEEATDD